MLFDIHTHIAQLNKEEIESMIDRWESNSVRFVVSAGTNPHDSHKSIKLSIAYKQIYAGIGLHPTEITDDYKNQISEICKLINEQVVTISEIGLDYLPDSPDINIQKYCFKKQIEMGHQYKLPIVFHMRKSNEDTLEILEENKSKIIGGASHYFQGSLKDAERVINLGMYVSFAKPLLRDKNLQHIAKQIPLDSIVLETDSYPQYFKKNRDRWTEPKDLFLVAEKLSIIKNLPIDEIIEKTTNNAFDLFGISSLS